ncbi:CDP-glycerol glycerophosphotransferase family protein [Clostridioides sp. GD02377]|uniref:bifunctional glycosyltransferase/CDP-glycerol:glycerophosphate glycerophosphotransferase n=1 Tax=unclassified Clostridioides TaxID=2635829 RepID=UPI00389DF978
MSYKISVIIPVYNVEDYIQECLDSIINQTLGIDNIEVIIVNDCSTDKSLEIVYEYAKKYKSIKILNRYENGGTANSRNDGLEYVTAEYITFVDSDDFISLNTYEMALKKIKENKCDLFMYEYLYYSKSGNTYERNLSSKIFDKEGVVTDICNIPEIIFATSVCNKIFSKKLFKELRFPINSFEDVLVSVLTTFNANKIYISDKCKYYYRKREDEKNISKSDNYLQKKKNYFEHLDLNLELYNLIYKYPKYKFMIDWFNMKTYLVFLYNMLNKRILTKKEKNKIFKQSKVLFENSSNESIGKLDDTFLIELVEIVVKSNNFNTFFIKILLLKLKNKNLFHVFNRFLNILNKLLVIFASVIVSIFMKTNPKYKNVWIISERGNDASDNGYIFFKYLRENHQSINVYYLISKENEKDFYKVNKLGDVIEPYTIKHGILFILSEKLVTAHKGAIEPWNYKIYNKYFSGILGRKKYIFLQHGIIKDDLVDILGRKYTEFDLFICGAKPEYDYVKSKFGYKDEVVYTGLARFDNLHEFKNKNQILLMPTWREYLSKKNKHDDRLFLNSNFYDTYNSFINNDNLIDFLELNNYTLIFYLHHEFQIYRSYFNSRSENIIIANSREIELQDMIKSSKLLITDYSSLYFDFAYMRKPVIYYQFDRKDFFERHYKKGYFDYFENGFGPVLDKELDIINYLKQIFINGDFNLEIKYCERMDKFFKVHDNKNCERIYNEIVKL